MKEFIIDFYGYSIFAYSIGLILSYVVLIWLAEVSILRSKASFVESYAKKIIDRSPYTPGVSIVAPAYNEERTIVDNVNSLLAQDYPKFEVVIVNDGSKDSTLEKLIENFKLVEVPFDYVELIKTKPFRRLFKSTDPRFARLTVVDKENGGTKADAVNAGLNVAAYPYFINTDVDCILARDAIYQCILPVLDRDHVIAVSGAMAMSNGCRVSDGRIEEAFPPHALVPLFQTLEYMRSFLVGKMGWSAINSMPNVSGGYGLFDREIVIAAGGYSPDSFAEDMDMLIRMVGYCCDFSIPYRVVQIPQTCCWTEGPPNIKVLARQRVRWGRGLIQTFARHKRFVFNRKYRQMGMLTLPYLLIFEFISPVIEFFGILTLLFLALTGAVNWGTALIIFLAIYAFCITLAIVVIFYDYTLGGSYKRFKEYLWILMAALLEPFIYHPMVVFFSLKGYWNYFVKKKAVWGEMTRKGYASKVQTN
ncbi:glycosyltransferase family 2 protein [Millionella massiliensis]|uniref:glycosyltransferase family 2 protein n=1 Tax=Millionella massiliensis TaxID=1871023 RepID=UPI0008D8E67B|nr:glycosyltransferase [Millionella massiliensis]